MNTIPSNPLLAFPPPPPLPSPPSRGKAQPLLRSVSMVGKSTFRMIQPVSSRRRCSSNEAHHQNNSLPLMDALKANTFKNSDRQLMLAPSPKDDAIQEEYLQDFRRWSHQQMVPLLPEVSKDCHGPLMPTRVTLRNIPLQKITATIDMSLQKLQEKNVLFSYRPHPDYAGRIELCSLSCKLKFVVQLWRTEDPTVVVVELQRRRGCPVYMHHLRRPLYKALIKLAAANEDDTSCLLKQNKLVSSSPAPIMEEPVEGETQQQRVATTTSADLPDFSCSCDRPLHFPPPLRLDFA